MNSTTGLKLLFIINSSSGNNKKDWHSVIQHYFKSTHHTIELYDMPQQSSPEKIKQKIEESKPQRVVAVGGDGTFKLVAQALQNTAIPVGIIPAGSANRMSKELEIPDDTEQALYIVLNGEIKNIHLVKINDQLCNSS